MELAAPIDSACHTAYLCPWTGQGQLKMPHRTSDEFVHTVVSSEQIEEEKRTGFPVHPKSLHLDLQDADRNFMLQSLASTEIGWEESEDEFDGMAPWYVGEDEDGREVIGLFGRNPIITQPTIEQTIEQWEKLLRAAGVVDLCD